MIKLYSIKHLIRNRTGFGDCKWSKFKPQVWWLRQSPLCLFSANSRKCIDWIFIISRGAKRWSSSAFRNTFICYAETLNLHFSFWHCVSSWIIINFRLLHKMAKLLSSRRRDTHAWKITPIKIPEPVLVLDFCQIKVILWKGSPLDAVADVLVHPQNKSFTPTSNIDKRIARLIGAEALRIWEKKGKKRP